jgi:predicted flap endonuclease-1-like 5' DNA nuclease
MDEFGTEFPYGIGRVAKRELAANGFTRYDQLADAAARDLLRVHGIGPKAIRILREELAARDLTFADDRGSG